MTRVYVILAVCAIVFLAVTGFIVWTPLLTTTEKVVAFVAVALATTLEARIMEKKYDNRTKQ